jgi:thiamine biosynthesis lipoprotein
LKLLKKHPEYSAILITDEGKVVTTKNLNIKRFYLEIEGEDF